MSTVSYNEDIENLNKRGKSYKSSLKRINCLLENKIENKFKFRKSKKRFMIILF